MKITISPEQITKLLDDNIKMELEVVSVEEVLNGKSFQDFRSMVVVFDDMLGSNRKVIDSFLSRDDIMFQMFIIYHNQILIYLKEQLGTTFTLYFISTNLVEHINSGIAGFDMSVEEFKQLCRKA